MPARVQQIQIGFGFRKQADIATANAAAGVWQLKKLNTSFANPALGIESDADEMGKGHEFETASFRTAWSGGPYQIEKYLSSQIAAFAFAFGFGGTPTRTSPATGAYQYITTPMNLANAGLELPYFSFIEQAPSGVSVVDRMLVGCAVEGFKIDIAQGAGRQNAKITVDFVHSGKLTEPSGITLPALTADKLLPAAGATALVLNGIDYLATKRLMALSVAWKNDINLDSGFYVGSGFQTAGDATTGAIRGRLEVGKRMLSINATVRLEANSQEWTRLKAQTQASGQVILRGDLITGTTYHQLQIDFTQLRQHVVSWKDASDGTVVADLELVPQFNSTLCSATIITDTDNIGL